MNKLEELDNRIERFEEVLSSFKTRKMALSLQKEKSEENLRALDSKITANMADILTHQKSIEVFKRIADTRNEDAKQKLEDTLNWALSQIPLEQSYSVILEESESGKELDIKLRELESGRERSLKDQSGIALCQIVSFLIDIILICISNSTRIMVLDEAFSGLEDKEMIQVFGEILVALARTENFQFIIIEHKTNLDNVDGIIPIELKYTNYKRGTVISQPSIEEMEIIANSGNIATDNPVTNNTQTSVADRTDDSSLVNSLLSSDVDFEDDVEFDLYSEIETVIQKEETSNLEFSDTFDDFDDFDDLNL